MQYRDGQVVLDVRVRDPLTSGRRFFWEATQRLPNWQQKRPREQEWWHLAAKIHCVPVSVGIPRREGNDL